MTLLKKIVGIILGLIVAFFMAALVGLVFFHDNKPAQPKPQLIEPTPSIPVRPIYLHLEEPDTKSAAIMSIDGLTKKTLMSKNENTKREIASLTKVMTTYIALDKIKKHQISLDDKVIVSKKAWKMHGSRMFIEVDKEVPLETLLNGLLVVSGNDAAVAIAEHISGTEEAFVDLMNQYAKNLGMTNTLYANSNGLPSYRIDQYSTAKDQAILAFHIINEFPEVLDITSQLSFEFDNIKQANRNKLLKMNNNYKGLKTGYTYAAKYGIISVYQTKSTKTGTHDTVITVILGAPTADTRISEANEVTSYASARFENIRVLDPQFSITSIPVKFGEEKDISVYPLKDSIITIDKNHHTTSDITLQYRLTDTIRDNKFAAAPIQKNMIFGEVSAYLGETAVAHTTLISKDDIIEGSFIERTKDLIDIKLGKF